MKTLASSTAIVTIVLCTLAGGEHVGPVPVGNAWSDVEPDAPRAARAFHHASIAASTFASTSTSAPDRPGPAALADVVEEYCVRCHNERRLRGNLSLEGFDPFAAHLDAEVAEKMIVKLRTGMMPPPGAGRPAGDTLQSLVVTLESVIDEAAAANPNPGYRRFPAAEPTGVRACDPGSSSTSRSTQAAGSRRIPISGTSTTSPPRRACPRPSWRRICARPPRSVGSRSETPPPRRPRRSTRARSTSRSTPGTTLRARPSVPVAGWSSPTTSRRTANTSSPSRRSSAWAPASRISTSRSTG